MIAKIKMNHASHMEVDLSKIEDAVLFEELEERGFNVIETDVISIIDKIYHAKANNQCYNELVNNLIDETLGRIL